MVGTARPRRSDVPSAVSRQTKGPEPLLSKDPGLPEGRKITPATNKDFGLPFYAPPQEWSGSSDLQVNGPRYDAWPALRIPSIAVSTGCSSVV